MFREMPYSLNASGSKWTTAPAISAPAANDTKNNNNFLNDFSFKAIVSIPIKAT